MKSIIKSVLVASFALFLSQSSMASTIFGDTTKVYAVPLLTQSLKGNVALSWTEKDNDGTINYFWSESKD